MSVTFQGGVPIIGADRSWVQVMLTPWETVPGHKRLANGKVTQEQFPNGLFSCHLAALRSDQFPVSLTIFAPAELFMDPPKVGKQVQQVFVALESYRNCACGPQIQCMAHAPRRRSAPPPAIHFPGSATPNGH